MTTEFGARVDAAVAKKWEGHISPEQRITLIAQIEQAVQDGLSMGEVTMANIVSVGDRWRDAIHTVRAQNISNHDVQLALDKIAEAIPGVSRTALLDATQIPHDLMRDPEEIYEAPLENLREQLQQLARQRWFAELTDPEKSPTVWSRNPTNMTRSVKTHRNALMTQVGMSGSIETTDYISRFMQKEPGYENFAQARVNNRVLTEAMITRFLEGSTLDFRRASGQHGGSTIDYQAPTYEPMRDERVRRMYQSALTTLLNRVDTETDWSPEVRNEMFQNNGQVSVDRLGHIHEAFASHLFDGIAFSGELRPGQDMRDNLGHTRVSDPRSERSASFARGVALHILIEGGDMRTYTEAMRALPIEERSHMGEVAQQLYSQSVDTAVRQRITQILQNVHGLATVDTTVGLEPKADHRRADTERLTRGKEAEQMLQATREQIEERMLRIKIESARMSDGSEAIAGVTSELRYSRKTNELRQKVQQLGKQLVWAKVVQDALMADLAQVAQRYVDGAATSVDYSDEVQKRLSMLERIDDAKCVEPDTLRYVRDRDKPDLAPDAQKTLVLARLSALLLSSRYFYNEPNMATLMTRLLYNAQNNPDILGGVTQADVFDVYNRTMIAVAEYNSAVSPINPDYQFPMVDGLAYALKHKNAWDMGGREPMQIVLPDVERGEAIALPGVAEGFSPLYLDYATRVQQDRALKQETHQWGEAHVTPVAHVVEQCRRVNQYAITAEQMAGAVGLLESTRYTEPTRNTIVPSEEIKPYLDKLLGPVQQIRHLADIDAEEKKETFVSQRTRVLGNIEKQGAEVRDVIDAIEAFILQHGEELRNPPKNRIGLVKHTEEFTVARSGLMERLERLMPNLDLAIKQFSAKTESDFNLIRKAIQKETTDPQNPDLVAMRTALRELDGKVPTPAQRVRTYLTGLTQPPYNADDPQQNIQIIRVPTNGRVKSLGSGSQEYLMTTLLAEHSTCNTVATQLMTHFLVQDHAWCEPIAFSLRTYREAVKQNGGSTALATEVTTDLAAIERKISAHSESARDYMPADKHAVAVEIMRLFKHALNPLVGSHIMSSIDTSPVTSVGAGSLKQQLDGKVVPYLRSIHESPLQVAAHMKRWGVD